MKKLKFTRLRAFLLIAVVSFFFNSQAFSSSTQTTYSRYKTKSGDSLSTIYFRLKLSRLFSQFIFLNKTIRLNKNSSPLFYNKNTLRKNRILKLPINNYDPRFKYDSKGFLIIPSFKGARFYHKGLVKKIITKKPLRRGVPKSELKAHRIKSLNFEFDCSAQKFSFKDLGDFVEQHKNSVEVMNIKFKCLSAQGLHGGLNRSQAPSFSKSLKENTVFYSSLDYSQNFYKEGVGVDTSFSNLALSLRYRPEISSSGKWLLDSKVQFDFLSLSSDISGVKTRFLNLDFQLGRSFSSSKSNLDFTLFLGAHYSQMFVTNDAYGYKNIYYPQIHPEFSYGFSSGNSLDFYLAYMPTGKNFFSFNADERSIDMGLQYNFKISEQKTSLRLNYSSLKFKADTPSETPVESEVFTFSIGLGF